MKHYLTRGRFEIEAFNRSTCAVLSPWDILLIRRIDDHARAVALGEANPSSQITARVSPGCFGDWRPAERRKVTPPRSHDRVGRSISR